MELNKKVQVGQKIRYKNKKLIVCKVNAKTVTLREYTDRAVRGTNRRRMTLGEFFTATIV